MTNSKKQTSARFLGNGRKSTPIQKFVNVDLEQIISFRRSTFVETSNWSNAQKAIELAKEEISEGFSYILDYQARSKDEISFSTSYGTVYCELYKIDEGVELIAHSVDVHDIELSFTPDFTFEQVTA